MRRMAVVALGVLIAFPGVSRAQVAWEAPPLVGTESRSGLSLFLVDPSPGDGLAGLVQWRHAKGLVNIGYRAGLVADSGDVAVFGGIDVSRVLAHSIDEADVDVRWWSGVGGSVGDEVEVSVPLGIVVGWEGRGDDILFAPYAGGHAVLSARSGPGDAIDLGASIDLGLDLGFANGWMMRAGASLGDRDALAIGLKIPRGGAPPER